MLDWHLRVRAWRRARERAGRRSAMMMAMMPMTTRSSTRVKARGRPAPGDGGRAVIALNNVSVGGEADTLAGSHDLQLPICNLQLNSRWVRFAQGSRLAWRGVGFLA